MRLLADWCAQPERSQLAVALGGGPLLDWLVGVATAPQRQGDPDTTLGERLWAPHEQEQQQAQRALVSLLQSGERTTPFWPS